MKNKTLNASELLEGKEYNHISPSTGERAKGTVKVVVINGDRVYWYKGPNSEFYREVVNPHPLTRFILK